MNNKNTDATQSSHSTTPSADATGPLIPAHVQLPEITFRAVVLGVILTIVLAAANAYLGLKVGITVSASIPSAVISMGILRFFKHSNVLVRWLNFQQNTFDSFETDLNIDELMKATGTENPYHAVFIRAPIIESVSGDAKILASVSDGRIVAAQQGHLLATSFHPELTNDTRFHEYFLSLVD